MPAEVALVGTAAPAAPRPEAALAAAVLSQAVADARDGGPVQAAQARAWLARSPWAAFWCAVAGLDVEALRGRLEAGLSCMPNACWSSDHAQTSGEPLP